MGRIIKITEFELKQLIEDKLSDEISKDDLLKLSYKDIFTSTDKNNFLTKNDLLKLQIKYVLSNKEIFDVSDIRKIQLKAFSFLENLFPNKPILFLYFSDNAYKDLKKLNYGSLYNPSTKIKFISDKDFNLIFGEKPDEGTSINKMRYWVFSDVVIFKIN